MTIAFPSDQELLVLAAKCLGVTVTQGKGIAIDGKIWNPLKHTETALFLALNCGMAINLSRKELWFFDKIGWRVFRWEPSDDPKVEMANIRKRITHAAATIGMHI